MLPPEKWLAFKNLVLQWSKKKRVSKKELLRLLGKLNWCCKVIRGGRTFLRRLIDLSMRLKKNHHRIWLNKQAKADINWWVSCMDFFHGKTKFVDDIRPPTETFHTDSSRIAGGGIFNNDWFYINFEKDLPEYKDAHINTLELLVVLMAARRWGHLWKGKHIKVRCDNSAACNAINKGSSRSERFMDCLRELFWISVYHDFRVTAVHIKGTLNTAADIVSRLHEQSMKPLFESLFMPIKSILCTAHMSIPVFLSFQDGTPIIK